MLGSWILPHLDSVAGKLGVPSWSAVWLAHGARLCLQWEGGPLSGQQRDHVAECARSVVGAPTSPATANSRDCVAVVLTAPCTLSCRCLRLSIVLCSLYRCGNGLGDSDELPSRFPQREAHDHHPLSQYDCPSELARNRAERVVSFPQPRAPPARAPDTHLCVCREDGCWIHRAPAPLRAAFVPTRPRQSPAVPDARSPSSRKPSRAARACLSLVSGAKASKGRGKMGERMGWGGEQRAGGGKPSQLPAHQGPLCASAPW